MPNENLAIEKNPSKCIYKVTISSCYILYTCSQCRENLTYMLSQGF